MTSFYPYLSKALGPVSRWLALAGALLATPAAAQVVQNVPAVADAYVQGGGDSGKNYGTETVLRVKNTPSAANQVRESFIKYDLSSIKGEVISVQLVVNSALNPKGPLPVSAFAIADDSWTETGITADNRPARGRYLNTVVFTTISSRRYAFDITEYALRELKGDKRLSLMLADTTANTALANIVSREGDPQLQTFLQVTVRGDAPPASLPDVAADKFDIYLLIGQSNMAGRGEIGVPDRDTLRNVRLFTGTGWERALNPLNKYSTVRKGLDEQQLGPGYTFSRKLAAATGRTIGLVVNARGGSTLSQWQKGFAGSEDYDLYEEAVAQLRKVLTHGTFKGILWHQGESDQSGSSAYLAKFQKLVADLRQDLGVGVPVVVGELGKWRTSSENLNTVIRSIPANVSQSYYVPSDGLTPLNSDPTEPHFDGPSQRALGERYADKVLAVVYNQPPGTVWNGSLSGAWNEPTNWSPALVPTDTAHILVAPGPQRLPTISGPTAVVARTLTIRPDAQLRMSDGTLRVSGSWQNNGRFVATGGTVELGDATTPATLTSRSPSAFWNLSVAAGGLRLAAPTGNRGPGADLAGLVSVRRRLELRGNLNTQDQPLALLSDADGTALVANLGGTLLGSITVQHYLNPSANAGLGFHYLAAPVAGSTVADLATPGNAPVVNPAYNTSSTPRAVTPQPTVFFYDQSRLATATSNLAPFEQGFASPEALTTALLPGQGYAVQLPVAAAVSFRGTATTGEISQTLRRGTGPDAGWQLVGNPYPAPLAFNRLTPADRSNLDAAMYVFESTGPNTGQYRAYVNGLGADSVLSSGQGFLVRVSSGQSSGTLRLRDAHRRTNYPAGTGTPPADARPRVQLTLAGAGLADALLVYTQAGATAGLDAEFDASKLLNPGGLSLTTLTAAGEALAIDGRPTFRPDAVTTIPLQVNVPAAGSYSFTAAAPANLATGTLLYLRDTQLNTRTPLAAGQTVPVTLSGLTAPGRFFLDVNPLGVVTSSSSAASASVSVFPNPARGRFTVQRPADAATTATLLNTLGQIVHIVALPSVETVVDVPALPGGVYLLRLATDDGQPVTKRIVLE